MDLISKQEAIDEIRAFQAQVTCSSSVEWLNGMNEGFDHAVGVIELMEPSEHDAVPVVRCKVCKHRPEKICEDEPEKGFNLEFPDWRCPCRCDDGYYNWMPDDNWFCGNGEKEEK